VMPSKDLAQVVLDGVGITEVGPVGDGQGALCWVTEADGYFYGSNAGRANVSQFAESASGSPQLIGVAATTNSGATDSTDGLVRSGRRMR
jgi:hypothetical protein